MGEHYDAAETQNPERREADLFRRLPLHLAAAVARTPGLARHLEGVDADTVTSREALAALPVLRKPDLMAMQAADPPFGGWLPEGATPPRVFVSPGPVHEPQPSGADPYRSARGLHAAGFRTGDLVANCFGYHATPGGFILDEGARALGCAVYPAGPGNTEALVAALGAFRPDAYVGTPDFLKVVLERADEQGVDLSSIRRAFVSGGALFPSLREAYVARGVATMQGYATADLGMIAYETATGGEVHPGMVVNEGIILEIVTPGTGDPVAPGEVGEIVVTTLDPDWPLLRFGTGDMTKALEAPSPCGRTNSRIAGWMGRADQRTKVKGMFVDPAQVARLVRSLGLGRARLVVAREADGDAMTLRYTGDADEAAVADALRAETGLRGAAARVDTIPADGIVIEDARDYEG